jgi:hypothetical protein
MIERLLGWGVFRAMPSENTLNVLKLDGDWDPKTIKRTSESISSAAFLPDGSKIAPK